MEISVVARSGLLPSIQPDPAVVEVGDNVAWKLTYDSSFASLPDSLVWTVYFSARSPFESWDFWSAEVRLSGSLGPKVTIDGGSVSSEGEYKYGVRLENGRTKEVLFDDDPRLIVGPRSR